jgi:hypothetical protein
LLRLDDLQKMPFQEKINVPNRFKPSSALNYSYASVIW